LTSEFSELSIPAWSSHFRVLEDGIVRIGKSRVCLDVVIEQYENGMDTEDLVHAYDTLVLVDVEAAIAYYLEHHEEVRAYMARRHEDAEVLRAKIEAMHPRISRADLLARRAARVNDNDKNGQ